MLQNLTPATSPKPFAPLKQPNPPLHSDLDKKLVETDSVEFQQQLETELDQVKTHVNQCLKRDEKGFVVLDVDDTTLDNRDYYRDPKGEFFRHPTKPFYETWDQWIEKAAAPALTPTQKLIQWFNQEKIPYCFVTGRTEAQKEATLNNLTKANMLGESCKGLFCKPNEWWVGTTASHKKDIVKTLAQEFQMEPLASIGDRDADMMLPDSKRNFKLSSSIFYPSKRN